MSLESQLNKIQGSVQKFQRSLQTIKTSPGYIERLQSMMDKIENSILKFKKAAHTNYDDLVGALLFLLAGLPAHARPHCTVFEVARAVAKICVCVHARCLWMCVCGCVFVDGVGGAQALLPCSISGGHLSLHPPAHTLTRTCARSRAQGQLGEDTVKRNRRV